MSVNLLDLYEKFWREELQELDLQYVYGGGNRSAEDERKYRAVCRHMIEVYNSRRRDDQEE